MVPCNPVTAKDMSRMAFNPNMKGTGQVLSDIKATPSH